ncbi:uncharacterized protein N7459_002386 [Penicillium hispanicum]|uniref:uncharacterized protein n=1 Tax=Penicillium hispanicum TaxID=1080232 RepID=UPI002541C094|nr:uncharacterized protein N7459_002386 [Penicillium hispanicum]KAJ5592017.1 hypothetical protein N7459_002386 [Penicillium hispanicum]
MAAQCAIRVARVRSSTLPDMNPRLIYHDTQELQQLANSDQLGMPSSYPWLCDWLTWLRIPAMTVHYEESNIREISALIIGPPGTPYAFGFYQVRLITTNRGRTRFGPNLYASGKVCLYVCWARKSKGTWPGERNEQWSAAQGLESVLLSIQSLLSVNPYNLEPGFEDANTHSDQKNIKHYNAKIRHENLRLAVIGQVENALGIIQRPLVPPSQEGTLPTPTRLTMEDLTDRPFDDFCKQRFLWYLDQYKKVIQEGIDHETSRHGMQFHSQPFESPENGMSGTWNYPDLKERVERLEKALMEETQGWPAQGLALEKQAMGIAVKLRAQHEQVTREIGNRTQAMVDLVLVDDNPFLWLLTYFGRPMTKFDGGVLKIKIYISPHHPAEQPRVFVETPLYHVRVSTQKMLIYLPARADEMSRHIGSIIDTLEEESPPYNPLMAVNLEASQLCWGSKEEQRQYSRKLRRSVEDSIDHL